MSLSGKTAIITGGLTGIGKVIGKSLASQGARVIFNGMNTAQSAQPFLKDVKGEFSYIQANLRKPSQCRKLIQQTCVQYKSVDILVNSAGMQHISSLKDFSEELWEDIIAVNLSACFYTTKYSLPSMQRAKWGRIINIASVHGLVASVNKSAYVAAKHGLIGLTKSTALQNCKLGITCNAICPGWVITELIQKQFQLKAKENNCSVQQGKKLLLKEKQPSQTAAEPEAIAEMVKLLCSESGQQINGASWTIDGGWTAQ